MTNLPSENFPIHTKYYRRAFKGGKKLRIKSRRFRPQVRDYPVGFPATVYGHTYNSGQLGIYCDSYYRV